MAEFIYVGSDKASGNKTLWQLQYDAGALSVITGIAVTSTVFSVHKGWDGYLYVGTASAVGRYSTDLILDTTWGTNGFVTVGAACYDIELSANRQVTAAHSCLAANTCVTQGNSLGSIVWRQTISGISIALCVKHRTNGNVLVGYKSLSNGQYTVKEFNTSGTITADYMANANDGATKDICVDNANSAVYGIWEDNDYAYTNVKKYVFSASSSPAATWTLDQTNGLVNQGRQILLHSQNSMVYAASLNSPQIAIISSSGTIVTTAIVTGLQLLAMSEGLNGNIFVAGNVAAGGNCKAINSSGTLLASLASTAITANIYSVAAGVPTWAFSPPAQRTYSRSFLAFGNEQIWQASASAMSEITAARGTISTDNPMDAVSLNQKVYIVNGTTFKVVDFINSRISSAAIGSAPVRNTTLTGGTSGAKMILDFCTVSTGAAVLYGYRTTAATFQAGETVTAGTTSFVCAAAETSAPHVYDWTPYWNNSTLYGSMASAATWVSRYQGRVIFNNKDRPHQWHMSRVLDPYDYLYTVNDPLSPIKGNDAAAGEVGDILVIGISYRDDYFIFGCVNSMWLLRGNPAEDGSINVLTEDTGIYGPKAWCLDDDRNLYWFGRSGLYKLENMQSVRCISELALPNWTKDWELNESQHHVVLTYDPVRKGITASKTILSTGVLTAYWYDFKTQGFYPEDRPVGIYCSLDFAAQDPTYRKTLYGCSDGFVREMDDSSKDDVTASSTAVAIESYCVMPITQVAPDQDANAVIKAISVINAGGASSGDFGDTDSLTVKLYTGDNPETILEDIKDGATALISANISGSGRGNKMGFNLRTTYLGVKVSNSAVNETWALERIYGESNEGGRK